MSIIFSSLSPGSGRHSGLTGIAPINFDRSSFTHPHLPPFYSPSPLAYLAFCWGQPLQPMLWWNSLRISYIQQEGGGYAFMHAYVSVQCPVESIRLFKWVWSLWLGYWRNSVAPGLVTIVSYPFGTHCYSSVQVVHVFSSFLFQFIFASFSFC